MKNSRLNSIFALLFCVLLFAVPLLFLVLPERDFSELEKRYLAKSPELSARNLADGSFTQQLESYVCDHFPGRELLVGINAYYDLLSGRQGAKDYFLRDGRLFAQPAELDRKTLDANLNAIESFRQTLAESEAQIPVYVMPVPSSGAVLLKDMHYPDAEVIAEVCERCGSGTIDLFEVFTAFPEPSSLYYRTDHHWTSEGAFEAVCAFQTALGRPCPVREDYQVESHEGFRGSAYSASGLWLTEPDRLELWLSGNLVQVSNETGEGNDSVFYRSRLSEQDMYTVFLDGNHALVRIDNLNAQAGGGKKLLLIRDSYSNSMACFLADLYETVILVDLRYYKLPLTDLINEEGIDEVLIEYSVDNLLHDASMVFLSADGDLLKKQDPSDPVEHSDPEEPEDRPPNYLAPPSALTEEFFDKAFFLGDSVLGPLFDYCMENDKLSTAYISCNAMLSYKEIVRLVTRHLVYEGYFSTLPTVLQKMKPEILITSLGCNDLANCDLEKTKTNFLAFLDMVWAEDPEITVFVQSVMPVDANMVDFNEKEVAEYNAWLRENAEVYGYCYIEVASYFTGPDGLIDPAYKANATHLNIQAGPVWYEQLLNMENYTNFPEKYYVEYDGATGLPVGAAPEDRPEPEQNPEPVPEIEPQEQSELDRIYACLCENLDLPEMLELGENSVCSYLGLDPGQYLEGRFYLCASNLKADEIWLLKLPDEDSAQRMSGEAVRRMEIKAQSYDQYLPEESELARRGIVVVSGRYVALFISPEAETMREFFLSMLEP